MAGASPHVKGEKTNESEVEVSEEMLSAGFGTAENVERPTRVATPSNGFPLAANATSFTGAKSRQSHLDRWTRVS